MGYRDTLLSELRIIASADARSRALEKFPTGFGAEQLLWELVDYYVPELLRDDEFATEFSKSEIARIATFVEQLNMIPHDSVIDWSIVETATRDLIVVLESRSTL